MHKYDHISANVSFHELYYIAFSLSSIKYVIFKTIDE